MTTITISQRKGGVGKSSSALNLGAALAEQNYRVLILDLDDQQNASTSIAGFEDCPCTIEDLIMKETLEINEVIIPSKWPNVWILPASNNLSGVNKHLDKEVGGHLILKERLSSLLDMDFVLIDTGASMSILITSALCASDYLFIPLSSQFFSMHGLTWTLGAYNKTRQRLNRNLKLLGMAFVIHDRRNALANEIVEKVREQYPDYLFETVIGTNTKVERALVDRKSILSYAPKDRGAQQYRELGREVVRRIEAREQPGEELYG